MSKTLPSNSGYFNKDMLAILNKGEKKTASKKQNTAKKTTKKSK